MNMKLPPLHLFRWIVFILALGYWLYSFLNSSMDHFGIQFRHLTNWGLTANVAVAWMLLRISEGSRTRNYDTLVSAVTVLNFMVLFLYWRLFLIDPNLVNTNGSTEWYLEYYLHGLGPVLLLLDAFFLHGNFRRIWRPLIATLAIMISYVAWLELIIGPMNDYPAGKATSGLPYPFLNDMDMMGRAVFYGGTIGTASVFFAISVVIAMLLRRNSNA